MKTKFITFLFCFLSIFIMPIKGQEISVQSKNIKFYLDCNECDFTYVRQNLDFISFVRDPNLADVHILVTSSNTGGGGHKYFINFIGREAFENINFNYETTTNQSYTDDDTRKALLTVIQTGILQYYSKADLLNNMSIRITETSNRKADEMIFDPWKNWVFSIEAGAELQKEESQNEYSIAGEIDIRKVTEKWKTNIEGGYEINRENYFDKDKRITDEQDTREVSAELIISLDKKWSAGFFTDYLSRNYLNINHRFSASTGIEYNFFPWSESNRHIFAVRYIADINYFDYIQETIYEKMKETLFGEQLEVIMNFVQPWGEIMLELQGRHYFNDFSKNSITLESDFSIRLSSNFSLFFNLETNMIHDQLYLPKGDASLEDILLRRRKLASTYEINGQLGLRFTFGSIYNNIVNERF